MEEEVNFEKSNPGSGQLEHYHPLDCCSYLLSSVGFWNSAKGGRGLGAILLLRSLGLFYD